MTWETSGLRSWLNGEFITNAFDAKSKKLIKKTKLVNADNSYYGTEGGTDFAPVVIDDIAVRPALTLNVASIIK